MLKTESFNIKSAHRMVNQQRALGNDVRWEGWDIVFRRVPNGNQGDPMLSTDGVYHEGNWCFQNRFSVNSEGKWEIDSRNLRRVRRAGNRR